MKRYFIYDEKEGILYRILTCGKKRQVGTLHSRGYLKFSYKGKIYYTHRFIWELCFGKIPPKMQIDHVNGDKTDNRLKNLRLVTNRENHRNKPMKATNKSGYNGVHYVERAKKWCAQIKDDESKTKHLGYFDSLKSAVDARKKAEKELGYHQNHGRRA